MVTLAGARGKLARNISDMSVPPRFRVGKYGVTLEDFERMVIPLMKEVK